MYHLKAHTISNKLVSKVSAQKKGEKSYDSYKYVFKFRWFRGVVPRLQGNKYHHFWVDWYKDLSMAHKFAIHSSIVLKKGY